MHFLEVNQSELIILAKQYQQGLKLVKWNLNSNDKRTLEIKDAQTCSCLSLNQEQDTVYFCCEAVVYAVGVKSVKVQEKMNIGLMIEAYSKDVGQSFSSDERFNWINASLLPDIVFLASEQTIVCIYIPGSQILKISTLENKIIKCQFFQFQQTIYAINSYASGLQALEITSSAEIGQILSGDKPLEAAPKVTNNLPKVFQSTMQDTTRFSDFDRDLEDQISQLKLDEMDYTQHTHYSQYTDQPSEKEQEELENDILKDYYNKNEDKEE